jgi:hypothetical protein
MDCPAAQYTLTYCDDEGDTVTVRTDDELEEALAIMAEMDRVPKFELVLHKAAPPPSIPPDA